jgi:hypothetical protein
VRATSVSYIDAEGQLVKRVGSSTADRMITQLMRADISPCEELSVGDFYSFAVVAQAAQRVASGDCPNFSRICHCDVRGELVPCLIQVEPYFTEQTLAGAKVTCLNVVAA